jgi:hypothetical protein
LQLALVLVLRPTSIVSLIVLLGSACAPLPSSPAPAPDAAVTIPAPPDAASPADGPAAAVDLAAPSDLPVAPDLAVLSDAVAAETGGARDAAPDLAPDAAPDMAVAPAAPGLYFVLRAGGVPTSLPAAVNGLVIEQVVLLLHELYLASDVGGAYLPARPADFSPDGVVMFPLPLLSPGLYSRLQIKVEAELEGGALPPALMGRAASIYVSGKTASGAPFVVRDTAESQTGIAAAAARDLKTGERLRATVSYDLERWFSGVILPGSGPVEIDSGHNPEQLLRFRANLMQSAALVLD